MDRIQSTFRLGIALKTQKIIWGQVSRQTKKAWGTPSNDMKQGKTKPGRLRFRERKSRRTHFFRIKKTLKVAGLTKKTVNRATFGLKDRFD